MKKWLFIAILVAIATTAMGARQTVVRTDLFGAGWTKQNNMNLELYQKTDPAETGFTGMDGAVITSGVVPSAKTLSPDKTSGIPSINFLYEANGTDTNGFGFLGPENSTKNILYRISDENPVVGNVFKVDSIATDQTITVGSGSIIADVVTLILADEAGLTAFPAYKDSTGTKGQYGINDEGTILAMCVDTNSWRTVALSDTLSLTPTTPTLTSLTIPPAGTTAEAVFSETMAVGAGGAGGWTLNDPTVAMTRTGGTGTVGDPVIFSLARTVLSTATENPYASYTQPTNGFESADDGVDLASIPNASVTNNSAQTGGVACTTDSISTSNTAASTSEGLLSLVRGQSFQVPVSGSLSAISITTTYTTDAVLEVRYGTSTNLGTTYIATQQFNLTDGGGTPIEQKLVFTNKESISSGTTYYIAAKIISQSETAKWLYSGNEYANGSMWYSPTAPGDFDDFSSNFTNSDFLFKIHLCD